MIKIKKFWIIYSSSPSPTTGTMPSFSKKFDSLEEAKKWASMRKENTKSYSLDYVILESIEYIEVPVPRYNWKKME